MSDAVAPGPVCPVDVAARPVTRSFKPRRRSLSAARRTAYDEAMSRFGLAVDGPVLSLPDEFGRVGRYSLAIGFGAGEALIELARTRPEECVIGVEVHTTGLAAVLGAAVDGGWSNVRVVEGDVLDFLPRLQAESLDEVRVFFPDPWPKQRQQHRRLIRADVVALIVDRLRRGGVLHLATDDAGYADQMHAVCAAERRLVGGVVDRPPWRPTTRYEARALHAGRTVVDLSYRTRARPADDEPFTS